jgi:hypothetical protein
LVVRKGEEPMLERKWTFWLCAFLIEGGYMTVTQRFPGLLTLGVLLVPVTISTLLLNMALDRLGGATQVGQSPPPAPPAPSVSRDENAWTCGFCDTDNPRSSLRCKTGGCPGARQG